MLDFLNNAHMNFYDRMVTRTHSQRDPYRKALFYTLGLTADTRNNIDSLYDFKGNMISFEGLNGPNSGWQTSTSIRVTQLAFNLYNGYHGEEDSEAYQYTPSELFCDGLMHYMFVAVQLRYPEYVREG